MKRFFTFVTLLPLAVAMSCNKYDNSDVRNQLLDHEKKIASIESAIAVANLQLSSVQSILSTIQDGDRITSVLPLSDSYVIYFAKAAPITIKNGEKGETGANGDGKTPTSARTKNDGTTWL